MSTKKKSIPNKAPKQTKPDHGMIIAELVDQVKELQAVVSELATVTGQSDVLRLTSLKPVPYDKSKHTKYTWKKNANQ